MLPSSAEIARNQTDLQASLLPDTCNILTPTNVIDAMGGGSITWGTAYAKVACRLDTMSGKEVLTSGEIMPFNTYVLTVPDATVITTNSRVEHDTFTFEVKSVTLDGSWSFDKRAILEII
jgi:head-tail adaptor